MLYDFGPRLLKLRIQNCSNNLNQVVQKGLIRTCDFQIQCWGNTKVILPFRD